MMLNEEEEQQTQQQKSSTFDATNTFESTDSQNKSVKESKARNLEALNALLPVFEMIMPDGRRLKKANQSTLRDAKFVDENGHAVMTEKYLKQICREQKAYSTPSLNDKVYFHYKGTHIIC
jgi:hypothetical protein